MNGHILKNIWRKLIGSPQELSKNNRMVNAVLVISLAFLILTAIINLISFLTEPLIINCVLIAAVCVLYQLSRVKKMHELCFRIYAVCSYFAVAVTFFYNAGSKGPAIFLFFLTFYLLIALSSKKHHLIWATFHIITGLLLLYIELSHPETIHGHYLTRDSRFIDLAFTYTVCLFFIYLITIHLRRMYDIEKMVANKRAELMVTKSSMIAKQNTQLKKIASVQSHEVRGQVATILGLIEILDSEDLSNPANKKAMDGIKLAALNLDGVIKNINELTR